MLPIAVNLPEQDTPQLKPIQVELPEESLAAPLSDEALDRRSKMAGHVLGMDPEVAKDHIGNWGEEALRKEASSRANLLSQDKYQRAIADLYKQTGFQPTVKQAVQLIDNMRYEEQANQPQKIFEKDLTKAYYDKLYQTSGATRGSWLSNFYKTDPEAAIKTSLMGRSYTYKQLQIQKVLEDFTAEASKESWPNYIGNIIKDTLTLGTRESFMVRGNDLDVPYYYGKGSQVETAQQNLFRMPDDEFDTALAKEVERVKGWQDPAAARNYFQKMTHGGDKFIDNAWDAITFLSLPGLGTSARVIKNASKAAVKSITNTAVSSEAPKVAIPAAAGDIETAAVAKVAETKTAELTGKASPMQDVIDELPNYLNDKKDKVGYNVPDNFRELATRIKLDYDRLIGNIMNTVQSVSRVDRIPEVIETATAKIKDLIKDTYHGPHNEVLYVGDPVWDAPSNSWLVETRIGKEDATYFGEEATARAHADRRGLTLRDEYTNAPGSEVKNDGAGWYISRTVSVPENESVIWANLLTTKASSTPEGTSLGKNYAAWLRNPSEVLSHDNVTNAKTMTYAGNNFFEPFKQEANDIARLARGAFISGTAKKDRWNAFEQTLEAITSGATRHPVTGAKGYRFESIHELNDFYLRTFQRNPVDAEVRAFFSWKRLEETVETFRSLRRYVNDMRVGARLYRITLKDEKGNIKSEWFEGREHPELPKGGDSIVTVLNEDLLGGQRTKSEAWGMMKQSERDDIAYRHERGSARTIEILRPGERPLNGFGAIGPQDRPRYVFHDRIEEAPLRIRTREEARPYETDYPYSIKQAIVKRDLGSGLDHYEGDRTALNFTTRAEAVKWEKVLDNIRKLIGEGQETRAMIYARQEKLPMDWAEHIGWYESGRFNTKEPFRTVRAGKNIAMLDTTLADRYPGTFRNASGGWDFHGAPDPYEVYTVQNKGGLYNPEHSFVPSKTMSAIPMMNRALTRVTNSLFMDDYKNSAVMHWLKEARDLDLLNASQTEMEHSPLSVFYNATLKGDARDAAWNRLSSNREKIKHILGAPSKLETELHGIAETLSETKAGSMIPFWALPYTTDVARGLRTFAYHAVLGNFSPAQLFIQNMNYLTIFSIAGGRHAVPGTVAGFLHQLSRINETWMPTLDKMAVRLSEGGDSPWKHGQLTEARRLLLETGFHKMVAEHAMFDNPYSARLVKNAGATFIDAASIFMKEGERNQRYAAFYTAYRMYREQHPTGPISNYDKNQIFAKADLMAGDMSRVSKTIMEKGPFSFATQFMSYSLRLQDMMTGTRLTPIQKGRLLTSYFVMGGLGGALGLATGYPFGDHIREYMLSKGYKPDEKNISSWIMEGMPTNLTHMITGNWYNIPQKFFSVSFDQIRDLVEGDKSFLNIFGGAAWNTLSTGWGLTSNLRTSVWAAFHKEAVAPIVARDLWGPLQTIKNFSDGVRLLAAINTHNWLGKKGNPVDENISEMNAILMTLTGLQPYYAAYGRNYTGAKQNRDELYHWAEGQFVDNYVLYRQAEKDGNVSQQKDYFKKMNAPLIIAKYPEERMHILLSKAHRSTQSVVTNIMESLYLKDVAREDKELMQSIYFKIKKERGIK